EVVLEARFKESTRVCVERLARRIQYRVHNRRHLVNGVIDLVTTNRRALQPAFAFFAARQTLAAANRVLAAVALALQNANRQTHECGRWFGRDGRGSS